VTALASARDREWFLAILKKDGLDEEARRFYSHHGVRELLDDRRSMFLLLKVARQFGLGPLD